MTDLAQRMFADVLRRHEETQLALIKANPREHKLTPMFDVELRWRYFDAGKDGRGWRVRFCWSTTRNAAGYFLTWREVRPGKNSRAKFKGKRDQFAARKVRKRAKALAQRRTERFQEKHGEAA